MENGTVLVSTTSLAALRALRESHPNLAKRSTKTSNVNGLLGDDFNFDTGTGTSATSNDNNDDDTRIEYWSEAAAFDENGNVTGIDFGGSRLRSLDALILAELKSTLVVLNLGGTDLPSDVAGKAVTQLHKLAVLCIGGNGYGSTAESFRNVTDIVRSSCPSLTKLDLRYNDIGPENIKVLCQAIIERGKGGKLSVLHLEGNNVGDDGCKFLASVLTHPDCAITELYLGDNSIGPNGASSFAEALKSDKTCLAKLFLEGNRIGASGASALAEALECLWAKAKADVEEEKAEVIEEDLAICLKSLYLDNNDIGKAGMNRVAKALKSATAIGDGLVN